VTLRLVAASVMASAAIAGGLAIQMAAGHDPALGAGTRSAQTQATGASQGSGSSSGFGDLGQSGSGSDSFGQSASPPASVTTRSS
jgi:hypothetical protein